MLVTRPRPSSYGTYGGSNVGTAMLDVPRPGHVTVVDYKCEFADLCRQVCARPGSTLDSFHMTSLR